MPSPWSIKGPSQAEEEGKLINISVGYEVLPLCIGPAELCINVSWQTWAFTLPPKKDFWTLLGVFTALSLSVNHVYTTETLGKELGKEHYAKGLLIRTSLMFLFVGTNVKPSQENQCLWLIIQLLIGDPMVCGYLIAQMILTTLCVIWKVTDTRMEHHYDKGFLG